MDDTVQLSEIYSDVIAPKDSSSSGIGTYPKIMLKMLTLTILFLNVRLNASSCSVVERWPLCSNLHKNTALTLTIAPWIISGVNEHWSILKFIRDDTSSFPFVPSVHQYGKLHLNERTTHTQHLKIWVCVCVCVGDAVIVYLLCWHSLLCLLWGSICEADLHSCVTHLSQIEPTAHTGV